MALRDWVALVSAPLATAKGANDANIDNLGIAEIAELALADNYSKNASDSLDERAAIAEFDGTIPKEWVEGFAHLQMMLPHKDFSLDAWNCVINDCGKFLDQWGPRAMEVGWDELDLFGVHPQAPNGNVSYWGLVLVLAGKQVSALNEDDALISQLAGHDNVFRRTPHKPGCIPIWRL